LNENILSEEIQIIKLMGISDPQKYDYRIDLLRYHFFLFDGNYKDFQVLLEELKDPDAYFHLIGLDDPKEFDEFMFNSSRRLINVLGMAMAIKDSTRRLMNKWYSDSKLLDNYREQINNTFTNNSLVQFFEELRNYSYHFRLPIVYVRLQEKPDIDNVHVGVEFILRKNPLLQKDDWSKGKKYLDSLPENIDIEKIVRSYYDIIKEFYNWLELSIKDFHQVEFEWLEEMELLIKDHD
jgi:hypothetical protein